MRQEKISKIKTEGGVNLDHKDFIEEIETLRRHLQQDLEYLAQQYEIMDPIDRKLYLERSQVNLKRLKTCVESDEMSQEDQIKYMVDYEYLSGLFESIGEV